MDETHLIELWPGMLARDDLYEIRRQREELEVKRADLDRLIADLRAQEERRLKIVGPLLDSGISDLAVRFWRAVRVVSDEDSCWEFTNSVRTAKNAEYGSFRVSADKVEQAHRVAYMLTNEGPMPPVVRHTCDNPPCCRPKHLIPGTQLDNIQDRVDRARGRGKGNQRGESNDSAVLTDQIVLEARRSYRGGESGGQIARSLGVDVNTLGQAIRGNSWTHLNDIEPPCEGRRSGAKVTAEDVPVIRKRAAAGEKSADIAKDYGVTTSNIIAIVKRKSWKHVL